MLVYDLLGKRHQAATFDMTRFSLADLRTIWTDAPQVVQMYRNLRERAAILGRDDAMAAIDRCLAVAPPARAAA
jgi:hypothetical protein